MNKLLMLIFIMSVTLNIYGQDTSTATQPGRDYYLKKSQNQITASRILMIGGGVMFLTGIILVADDVGGIFDPEDKDNSGVSTVLLVGGGAAAIISIPLYLASKRNARMAASLSFGSTRLPQMAKGNIRTKNLPSLRLTIPL